jgi:hypothetical protein
MLQMFKPADQPLFDNDANKLTTSFFQNTEISKPELAKHVHSILHRRPRIDGNRCPIYESAPVEFSLLFRNSKQSHENVLWVRLTKLREAKL